MVVEPQALLRLDRRHVAFDASRIRGNWTGDVFRQVLLVAADALLDVLRSIGLVDRCVWVMTGRALQLAIGIKVASAPQQTDRLEPDQEFGVLADFLFRDAPG